MQCNCLANTKLLLGGAPCASGNLHLLPVHITCIVWVAPLNSWTVHWARNLCRLGSVVKYIYCRVSISATLKAYLQLTCFIAIRSLQIILITSSLLQHDKANPDRSRSETAKDLPLKSDTIFQPHVIPWCCWSPEPGLKACELVSLNN